MRINGLTSVILLSGVIIATGAVAAGEPMRREQASMRFFFARAAAGESGAQLLLGDLLLQSGHEREALPWFIKAANRGNCEAQYRLGVMYDIGLGTAIDEEQAARWLLLASRQGEPLSFCRLLLREVTTAQIP